MKKTVSIFFGIIISIESAHAEFSANNRVGSLRVNSSGVVTFGTGYGAYQSGVCDYYAYRFKFNASGQAGSNMLNMLLLAKQLNRPVNIWYTPSSNPGSNENTGCSDAVLATVGSLAFQD